jgi:hypothetical protein
MNDTTKDTEIQSTTADTNKENDQPQSLKKRILRLTPHIILLLLSLVEALLNRALAFSAGTLAVFYNANFKQFAHNTDACPFGTINDMLLAIGCVLLPMGGIFVLMLPVNLIDYFLRIKNLKTKQTSKFYKVIRIMVIILDVAVAIWIVAAFALFIATAAILYNSGCQGAQPYQFYNSTNRYMAQGFAQVIVSMILQVIVHGGYFILFLKTKKKEGKICSA